MNANLLPYINAILKQASVRFEVHTFDSGAVMVDIWAIDGFYVVQIDGNIIGMSKVTKDDSPFETRPDHLFKDELAFKQHFENILLFNLRKTISFQHKEFTIELFDDDAFVQSVDSPTHYDNVIQVDGDQQYLPTSQHAIKIYRDNNLFNSAIIVATGGGTSVQRDSALIDDNNLVIRCCNKLFSLTIPDLSINWTTEVDWATCFSIHQYWDTYISHGETSIARIDKSGRILWSYSGSDIFVCLHEGNPFEMYDNYIALTDFNGSTYRIDYDGKTIDYSASDYHAQVPVPVILKTKKKWWMFW
jgi:hypothetical protein